MIGTSRDHVKSKSPRFLTLPYKAKVIWPSKMFKSVCYTNENLLTIKIQSSKKQSSLHSQWFLTQLSIRITGGVCMDGSNKYWCPISSQISRCGLQTSVFLKAPQKILMCSQCWEPFLYRIISKYIASSGEMRNNLFPDQKVWFIYGRQSLRVAHWQFLYFTEKALLHGGGGRYKVPKDNSARHLWHQRVWKLFKWYVSRLQKVLTWDRVKQMLCGVWRAFYVGVLRESELDKLPLLLFICIFWNGLVVPRLIKE